MIFIQTIHISKYSLDSLNTREEVIAVYGGYLLISSQQICKTIHTGIANLTHIVLRKEFVSKIPFKWPCSILIPLGQIQPILSIVCDKRGLCVNIVNSEGGLTEAVGSQRRGDEYNIVSLVVLNITE